MPESKPVEPEKKSIAEPLPTTEIGEKEKKGGEKTDETKETKNHPSSFT
jgi:hypothetical protein